MREKDLHTIQPAHLPRWLHIHAQPLSLPLLAQCGIKALHDTQPVTQLKPAPLKARSMCECWWYTAVTRQPLLAHAAAALCSHNDRLDTTQSTCLQCRTNTIWLTHAPPDIRAVHLDTRRANRHKVNAISSSWGCSGTTMHNTLSARGIHHPTGTCLQPLPLLAGPHATTDLHVGCESAMLCAGREIAACSSDR